MNADACETAARHLFGLMAAEDEPLYEAAAADDTAQHAARRRVEEVACAVALQASPPVQPPAYILPRVRAACGLEEKAAAPARRSRVIAWSGWGIAAAVVAAALIQWPRGGRNARDIAEVPTAPVTHHRENKPQPVPALESPPPSVPEHQDVPGEGPENGLAAQSLPGSAPADERAEKRRLIQELALLRPELERFRQRDREMFTVVPGRAWPLIVEMRPPGAALAMESASSPAITALIGESLGGLTRGPGAATEAIPDPGAILEQPTEEPLLPEPTVDPVAEPRAIPVYDPARDMGTLAVRDLAPAPEGADYNLWVATSESTPPVLAGTLPALTRASDSFDFTLGSTGFVPHSYFLTLDATGAPVAPGGGNIVLQGP